MGLIRNLLAIIGLVAVICGGYMYQKYGAMFGVAQQMAPQMEKLAPLMAKAGPAMEKFAPILEKHADKFAEFEEGALDMYAGFADRLLSTGDPGVAMMWVKEVDEGLSPDDVVESLKSLASSRNFLFVGEAPFYKQVKAVTNKDFRYVNFLSFCDARVGAMMADYRDAYTGFMPCRIAVIEGKDGKLRLVSMNLDMMIHGGKPLPPELKKEALRVRNVIWEMMEGAARGDF
ncbi:DUF302 domain-containing protein [Magnetofaba australis]|uniref:DUF302 domain-containing protein n=1 Tax=Magnetofaba australis IT-1 TaxID=1434232 RepID=A0A1Y2K226_9PROT|nr:DUF302 domain-containing protein [Magnetofaba australis]OSM02090.1 hypothetical protein MAIT1_02176 [Magnetofaba australis IT-1]